MQWSLIRQLLYALGAFAILAVIGTVLYFSYFYEAPSCTDGKQNQNEAGIDCGGVCTKLCAAPNVSVMWARAVPVAPGVYHAVALVRNPDTGATGDITYEVSLFDTENVLIARRTGSLSVGPGEVRTLFEPNVPTGERVPARTFVDITPGMFQKQEREPSAVRVLNWDFDEESRRLVAELQNQGTTPTVDTVVTALLFNPEGTLINASQTRSGALRAGERTMVTFTWPLPFTEPIERIDILPRVVNE